MSSFYYDYVGILDEKRYFAGSEVPCGSNYNNIDWRNENFEICDGENKKIVAGAERQPNPLGGI